jgi:hypothetical protein
MRRRWEQEAIINKGGACDETVPAENLPPHDGGGRRGQDCGKGRVVFTAAGHTIHAVWNPQYVELQKRSIH